MIPYSLVTSALVPWCQTLKIEAPSMTEEDQYGYNMPDRYKCDACRAVVFHLNEAPTMSPEP